MKKLLFLSFIFIFVTMLTAWCTKTEKTEENQKQNAKYDYLVLVNKQHKLPEDWEANVELVETKNAFGETIKVEKEALKKYNELRDALLEEGVDIELDSAYRSVSRQEELWKEFEEEYWIDYTQKYVAVPWYSEHHTALAIDICIKKDWELIYDNDEMTEEREIFAKVHEKLADYWFILRYLEGKDDITWYGYEPWHLRYIRDVDVAKEIMEKWLTLEEYLGEVNE
jgi:D-alanyl-D-alanine carboxypeptidase